MIRRLPLLPQTPVFFLSFYLFHVHYPQSTVDETISQNTGVEETDRGPDPRYQSVRGVRTGTSVVLNLVEQG